MGTFIALMISFITIATSPSAVTPTPQQSSYTTSDADANTMNSVIIVETEGM